MTRFPREATLTTDEAGKCWCGKAVLHGAVCCPACMENGINAGFTWDAVNNDKEAARTFLRLVWAAAELARTAERAEREEGAAREADHERLSKVVGQIGIIDPIFAATLCARIPGVREVARFPSGYGTFHVDVIVLEGPGLVPVAVGSGPPVFGYYDDVISERWPENVAEGATGGAKVPHHVEKVIRDAVSIGKR